MTKHVFRYEYMCLSCDQQGFWTGFSNRGFQWYYHKNNITVEKSCWEILLKNITWTGTYLKKSSSVNYVDQQRFSTGFKTNFFFQCRWYYFSNQRKSNLTWKTIWSLWSIIILPFHKRDKVQNTGVLIKVFSCFFS